MSNITSIGSLYLWLCMNCVELGARYLVMVALSLVPDNSIFVFDLFLKGHAGSVFGHTHGAVV